jgi:hypothetical protein
MPKMIKHPPRAPKIKARKSHSASSVTVLRAEIILGRRDASYSEALAEMEVFKENSTACHPLPLPGRRRKTRFDLEMAEDEAVVRAGWGRGHIGC